jgi:uncharacterized protein YbjQ (UPF0145 family)
MGRFSRVSNAGPTSAGGLAALRGVGLLPRPPVWGTTVVRIPDVVDTIGMTAPAVNGGSRVKVVVAARQRLLDSLSERTDPDRTVGLLAVEFQQRPLPITASQYASGTVVELSVTATPIWSSGPRLLTRPFRTAFDSGAVAALLRGGWVPVDLLIAGTTQTRAPRHRGGDAAAATSRANREIPGPSDMIQRGRRHVRNQLAAKATTLGADGVLLHGGFTIDWSSTYHLVQVSATATAIARWSNRTSPARTVLSMR